MLDRCLCSRYAFISQALAQHGEFVFVGAGDGVLKKVCPHFHTCLVLIGAPLKLMGHDLNWGVVLETHLTGAIVSLEMCDQGLCD